MYPVQCILILASVAVVTALKPRGPVGELFSAARQLKEFIIQQPMPVPQDQIKHSVATADSVLVDSRPTLLRYNTLMRSGQVYGTSEFGRLVDNSGTPLFDGDQPYISNDPDFSSLLPKGDKVYQITHFETPLPATSYFSVLQQDNATGQLTAVSTEPMDWSWYDGLWQPCAGSVTPWQTHLGSEEFEPDARAIADYALEDPNGRGWLEEDIAGHIIPYMGYNETLTNAEAAAVAKPYLFGYPWEAGFNDTGGLWNMKHPAMGRLSFELAYVLPSQSQRHAYMSDDGDNKMLARFEMTTPGQLSCGTLWGANVTQLSDVNGGSFNLSWIQVGPEACDEELLPHIHNTTFYDIFDAANPLDEFNCPAGFTSVNTVAELECLQVKAGRQLLASRLETRRYADMLGVTVEFSKMEGLTFDPDRSIVYIALSSIRRGMEDFAIKGEPSGKYDQPAATGGNAIRLPFNDCGCVYRLPVDEQGLAHSMEAELCGTTEGADGQNNCNIDAIANPDNIAFVHGHDGLLIAEDSSNHEINYHWFYNTVTKTLTRLASVPYGAEVTGSYFIPNINGWSYMLMNVQHPYVNEEHRLNEAGATGLEGWVGYLGPFVARPGSVDMLDGLAGGRLWNGFPSSQALAAAAPAPAAGVLPMNTTSVPPANVTSGDVPVAAPVMPDERTARAGSPAAAASAVGDADDVAAVASPPNGAPRTMLSASALLYAWLAVCAAAVLG